MRTWYRHPSSMRSTPGSGCMNSARNTSDETAQARVRVPWDELRGKTWHLNSVLSGEICDRSGSDMRYSGLDIDPGAWECNFFQMCAL
jgi:hypothetical protein